MAAMAAAQSRPMWKGSGALAGAAGGRLRSISMPGGVRDSLIRLAAGAEPREACALLVGAPVEGGAERAEVSRALPATNASSTPETGFSIPGGELIRAYREAEGGGLAIVGIFHSHPTSRAAPSEADRRMMRINPVAWVIYSGLDGEMRAYIDAGGGGVEEAAEIRIDAE